MKTKRATIPALEEILDKEIPVLDHGFIRLIDYMGSDQSIVDAARVSYGKGTKSVSDDAGLINYLIRHRHTSPLEQCEIVFHMKLPIFVARQIVRHRTASLNEYSGRYSVMDSDFYIPKPEHLGKQSKKNNQGRDELVSPEQAQWIRNVLTAEAASVYDHYTAFMNSADLARELARIGLPLNIYTQWYWKIDLHNLFHFLKLRCDPHAQYEIRAYADEILKIVALWVPLAYNAFMNFQMNAVTFSANAMEFIKAHIATDEYHRPHLDYTNFGLSKREFNEVFAALGFRTPAGKGPNANS
jgi:thymidylate synthase (FAD)